MRNKILIISLFAIVLGAGCGISQSSPPETEIQIDQQVDPAQETYVFETAVSLAMTDAAPPPSATFTQPPPATNTPEPTFTPEASPTPEIAPTSENPWVLQSWCEDHDGCERLEVKNQTDYWVNIYLKYLDTGTDGSFSIPKRGHAWITLRPGQYKYIFTSCGGSEVQQGTHAINDDWYLIYKDKWCN